MANLDALVTLFEKHGCPDFKWIEPRNIVLGQWVRLKCLFGCQKSGRHASCPPNVPPVSECREFFNEYGTGVIFHFQKALERLEERHEWTRALNQRLLELEREVFLSGYQKAFLLLPSYCNLCEECAGVREACKQPRMARPTPEAMGVDVYATVRRYGYPIEVLTDYTDRINRYAFLMVE